MSAKQTTDSVLKNITAGLDHLDPFQGFVDEDKQLNLRFGFQLGKLNLLIDKFTICEVIKKPMIYSVPNTPAWIQGMINLRGILVPVLDLKKHLEQVTDKESINDTLLIIDKGERAFGTFIEDIPKSINLETEDLINTEIPENLPESLVGHVKEAYMLENDVWLDINYDTFIKSITREYSDYQAEDQF